MPQQFYSGIDARSARVIHVADATVDDEAPNLKQVNDAIDENIVEHKAEADPHPQYLLADEVSLTMDGLEDVDATGMLDGQTVVYREATGMYSPGMLESDAMEVHVGPEPPLSKSDLWVDTDEPDPPGSAQAGSLRFVNSTGDSMHGSLLMENDATQPLEPVTLQQLNARLGDFTPGSEGAEEVWIGPDAPVDPDVETWFDTSTNYTGGPDTLDALYINAAGDAMEGPLAVLEPVAPNEPATKSYCDQLITVSTDPPDAVTPSRDGLLWIQVPAA